MTENEKLIEGTKMLHNNVENLSREVKKYLKKYKSDIIGTIEDEFGTNMSERVDDSLIDIKEKIINLAHYFDDEINYDIVPEMAVEIFEDIEKRSNQIVELIEELQSANNKFKDEYISEFVDNFLSQIFEINEMAADTLKDIK